MTQHWILRNTMYFSVVTYPKLPSLKQMSFHYLVVWHRLDSWCHYDTCASCFMWKGLWRFYPSWTQGRTGRESCISLKTGVKEQAVQLGFEAKEITSYLRNLACKIIVIHGFIKAWANTFDWNGEEQLRITSFEFSSSKNVSNHWVFTSCNVSIHKTFPSLRYQSTLFRWVHSCPHNLTVCVCVWGGQQVMRTLLKSEDLAGISYLGKSKYIA